jgi:8-oxo-dGTP pyrophosphatase MutT (NUDIX family)
MKLDCRVALVLWHPNQRKVLLLKRAAFKKLFPGLITGIGGKLELEKGEGEDLGNAWRREFFEETNIEERLLADVKLKLSTLIYRDGEQFLLLWYTGKLTEVPADLSCTEGELGFFDADSLPLAEFTPTAREAIPFTLQHSADDRVHNGVFNADGSLTTSI